MNVNTIDYVQIMTTGNAIDFGDLTQLDQVMVVLFKWSWRFIMSEFKVNTITNRDGSHGLQVCGITTFGSSGMQLPSGLTEFRGGRGRGVFAGGLTPSVSNTMDKVEIATTGNATDFGNLSEIILMVEQDVFINKWNIFGGR